MTEFKPLAEYPPEIQQIALAAFAKLADEQRGKPESMAMLSNKPLFNATGVFTYSCEHIGDLTHRMAQRHCEKMHYGLEMVAPKVARVLGMFRNYGLEREMNGNLRNNFSFYVKHKGHNGTFEDFVEDFKQAAWKYSKAHQKLIVYNKAQWYAREAAMALGLLQFNLLLKYLEILETHIEHDWETWASMVRFDNAGQIMPYNGSLAEERLNYMTILERDARNNVDDPYLYHATYQPYMNKIMKRGYMVKGKRNWEDSRPGVTYLASDPEEARSYAETSDNVPDHYLDNIRIIKVHKGHLDKDKLHADSNVLDNPGSSFEYHGVVKPEHLEIHE